MSWINFFDNHTELHHIFGRDINAQIAPNEESLFNESYLAFERKDMLDGYEYFLKSLENFRNETSNHNIQILREKEKLTFTLFQGTAKIDATITQENFYAEVILVKNENASVALKRYILERNYQLTYAYYFSDETYIKLKLFFSNETMSPQKVFFPIRELALNADFDKEHIQSEFNNTPLEDIAHLTPVDESEAKIKYKYLQNWIEAIEEKVATLPSNDKAGMEAFLYLNLIFKIDYLLVPKYTIYQKISKKVQIYFRDDELSIETKNEEIKRYINKLKETSFEEFYSNLYNAKYTFSPNEKSSFEETTLFISESLNKIRWYKNNRYNQIIPTMYSYIAFYVLYNYGLNQVLRDLMHLLVTIRHPEFFEELDYKTLYNRESETFSKREIKSKIEDIIKPHQKKFKLLETFGDKLNFTSLNEFSNSFYIQIKNLNFEEI